MKRILSLVFAAAMLLSLLAACSGTGKTETPKTAETVTMTDNAGREVTVPAEVTRVAPSGTVATMFLASVCPDYLVCIGSSMCWATIAIWWKGRPAPCWWIPAAASAT